MSAFAQRDKAAMLYSEILLFLFALLIHQYDRR